MAVKWKVHQALKVTQILKDYPPKSNRCETAAKLILPIAQQVDGSSRALKIKPAGRARYVLPKEPLDGEWWRYHVVTEVTEHYVDALTRTPGTLSVDYFAKHYQVTEREAYLVQDAEI